MAYSKPNLDKPRIENYAGYGKNAPEAAKALRGTTTVEGIKQAAEMRRQHGRAVQDRYTGPRTPGSRDNGRGM